MSFHSCSISVSEVVRPLFRFWFSLEADGIVDIVYELLVSMQLGLD
jgi:hypothetical protein